MVYEQISTNDNSATGSNALTAKALYDYEYDGNENDQDILRLRAGDLIQINQRDEDSGWWNGTILHSGTNGWFPGSYVELTSGPVSPAFPGSGGVEIPRITRLNINNDTVDNVIGATLNTPTTPCNERRDGPILFGDWEQYRTEDGEVYFVNRITGESQWELPDDMIPPELPVAPPPPLPDSSIDPSRRITMASSYSESGFGSRRHTIFSNSGLSTNDPVTLTRKPSSAEWSIKSKFSVKPTEKAAAVTSNGSYGYTDNFLSDKGDKSGFDILVSKHRSGKEICKDVAQFMADRAKIEEIYAKSLMELANSTLADQESGTMKTAWNQLKFDVRSQAKSRLEFSKKLASDVQKPLMDFKNEQKKTRKDYEATISEDRRIMIQKYAMAQKMHKIYISRSLDADMAEALVARGQIDTMTKKDFVKVEENARKERKKANIAAMDYKTAVEDYEKVRLQWEDDMQSASFEFQQAEENRIDFLKTRLDAYLKVQKQVNNDCKESTEMVSSSVDAVSKEIDIEMFVKTNFTGSQKPPPLIFERFDAAVHHRNKNKK